MPPWLRLRCSLLLCVLYFWLHLLTLRKDKTGIRTEISGKDFWGIKTIHPSSATLFRGHRGCWSLSQLSWARGGVTLDQPPIQVTWPHLRLTTIQAHVHSPVHLKRHRKRAVKLSLTNNLLHQLFCSCHSRLLDLQLVTVVIILMAVAIKQEKI